MFINPGVLVKGSAFGCPDSSPREDVVGGRNRGCPQAAGNWRQVGNRLWWLMLPGTDSK